MNMRRATLVLLAVITLSSAHPVAAGEVTLIAARVLRPILSELAGGFEASGHKLSIVYDTAGGVTNRVIGGEQADLAITQKPHMALLADKGKIDRASILSFARSGVAAGVPKGASKPDISSASAFRRALLDAQVIAYPDPAIGNASGVQFRRILEEFGLTNQVDAKAHVWQMPFVEWAAHNDADLVITQPTDILAAPRYELVGWLPDELQDYDGFTWTAGALVEARDREAAKALLHLLTSPAAQQIITRRGMKPTANAARKP